MSNRLSKSSSPYLLQHRHNPVDWYPWGDEALEKARRENKPIFLSIGYSSCHWCHVMEKESFSNQQVAEVLNSKFVSIKVDREERPDLDHVYMQAVQTMTGSGGWPLNVFLTPDLRPFFGGTYFPLEARYGRPPFFELLTRIAEVFETDPQAVRKQGDELMALLLEQTNRMKPGVDWDQMLVKRVRDNARNNFEPSYGGLGAAPKFFHVDALRLMLHEGFWGQDTQFLGAVEHSLKCMAAGGVYDQVGGGFHRYSTDMEWRVPHFEKMLYDNALLLTLYGEAWQVTENPLYFRIANEIAGWVRREMTDKCGAFYSAMDADSAMPANGEAKPEKREGYFYTWTAEELASVLKGEDLSAFMDQYKVTISGNYEERNILFLKTPWSSNEDEQRWRPLLNVLLQARAEREGPLTDTKHLTSWNALMISALARWGQNSQQDEYMQMAIRSADCILETAWKNGKLSHWFLGDTVGREGFLEDYAYFTEALLDLYEASKEERYRNAATEIGEAMISQFEDQELGGFWSSRAGQADLLVRSKEIFDGATPSAYAVAISALDRLHQATGKLEFRHSAERSAKAILQNVVEAPGGFHRYALAYDQLVNGRSFARQCQGGVCALPAKKAR